MAYATNDYAHYKTLDDAERNAQLHNRGKWSDLLDSYWDYQKSKIRLGN